MPVINAHTFERLRRSAEEAVSNLAAEAATMAGGSGDDVTQDTATGGYEASTPATGINKVKNMIMDEINACKCKKVFFLAYMSKK